MVKYFSVDWLAQSHHSPTGTQDTHSARTHRPHVPCMVQPFAPVYGKGYLQPKSKASNPAQHAEQGEFGQHPHSSLCAPLRPVNCSSPISENSGYSSGYESEAASSECHSVEDRSGVDKDAPQRRVRTKFTPKQILKLEKVFSKHKYLDAGERVKTAQKLNLTETQVRTWFQNRRMKLKREVQDHFAPQMPLLNFRTLPQVQCLSVDRQRHQAAPVRAFHAPPQLILQQQMTSGCAPLIHYQHFF
uniref:Ventral homeobox n=1 Tax=Oryzias sinensis TaxID=183150 RepID=A0A8C7XM50_9TELE